LELRGRKKHKAGKHYVKTRFICLYVSSRIITVIKSRRMGQAEHVARMER